MACGTWDGFIAVEGLLRLPDQIQLRIRKRLEFFHVAEVVLHLRQVAHTAEDHEDVIQACREAYRPAGIGTPAAFRVEHCFYGRDGIRQDAALYRLHDGYGLTEFFADLPVFPGSDAGIFPVRIVKLELHKFRVRVFCEQHSQKLRIGMEGEAPVPDQTFLFQLRHIIPDSVFFIHFIVSALDGVKQIVVDIADAGALQAGIELLPGVFCVLRHADVEFGRDGIAVTGIAVGDGRLESSFAGSVIVDVGCVKVSAARRDEPISHLTYLRNIDGTVGIFRKTHEAEA